MTSAELLNIGLDELVPAPMYACTATCESWPRRASTAACCSATFCSAAATWASSWVFSSSAVTRFSARMSDCVSSASSWSVTLETSAFWSLIGSAEADVGRATGIAAARASCHDDSPSHPEVAAVHDEARV